MPRQWFKFANAADTPEVADLEIFGSIGASWWDDDAVSAKQFLEDLSALPKNVTTIRVKVNSPGGDVFDGIAIANALREQRAKGRTVETTVEGIAASAASVVIMAGETIRIADNALVMVHQPYTIEIGNAAVMRKTADVLDQITDSIITTYRWHSEMSAEELRALMDAETWMDADEAIAKGFATDKIDGLKAAASIDPKAAAKLKVPEKFKARFDALLAKPAPEPQPAAAADVIRFCAEASLDIAFAQSLITAQAASSPPASSPRCPTWRMATSPAR
jgi:ATP-dependent protease ClpP protease subunit